MSAVLAEVGEAEGCRSEAVFLLFRADVDQHEDRHNVGNHLRELHRVVRHRDAYERRQVVVQPEEDAEHVCAPDRIDGPPGREDDQCDGEPAEGVNGAVGRPGAVAVVKHVIDAAKARNRGTDTGCNVFVLCDIDADGISGSRVFTDGAQVESGSCFIDEVVCDKCENDGKVYHETVGEENLSHSTQTGKARDRHRKNIVGDGSFDGSAAVQDLDAKEVCHTGSEGGEGKAGDILICAERDGEEAVDESAECRRGEPANHGDQNDENAARVIRRVLIVIRSAESGEAAEKHDSGNAEVQIAAAFRDDFSDGAEHNDGTEPDCAVDPCDESAHYLSPSFRAGSFFDAEEVPDAAAAAAAVTA